MSTSIVSDDGAVSQVVNEYDPDVIEVTDGGIFNGEGMEPFATPDDWASGPSERDIARAQAFAKKGPVRVYDTGFEVDGEGRDPAAEARAERARLLQLGVRGYTSETLPDVNWGDLSDEAQNEQAKAWRRRLKQLVNEAQRADRPNRGGRNAQFRDPAHCAREIGELAAGRYFRIRGTKGVRMQNRFAEAETAYCDRKIESGQDLYGHVQVNTKWEDNNVDAKYITKVYASLERLAPEYDMALIAPTAEQIPGTVYVGPAVPDPDPEFRRFDAKLHGLRFQDAEIDKTIGVAFALTTVRPFMQRADGRPVANGKPIVHITAPDGGGESGKTLTLRALVSDAVALGAYGEKGWDAAKAKLGDPFAEHVAAVARSIADGKEPRVRVIENVEGAFGSDDMSGRLTSPTFEGRTLQSCEYVKAPNTTIWATTGNGGFEPVQDIANRIVPLYIEAHTGAKRDLDMDTVEEALQVAADKIAILRAAPPIGELAAEITLRFEVWAARVMWPAAWYVAGHRHDEECITVARRIFRSVQSEIAKRQAMLQASSVAVDEITRGFADFLETCAKQLKAKVGNGMMQPNDIRRELYENAVWAVPWGLVSAVAAERNVRIKEFQMALQKNRGGNWVKLNEFRQVPARPVRELPSKWFGPSANEETRRLVQRQSSVVYWIGSEVDKTRIDDTKDETGAEIVDKDDNPCGYIDVLDFGKRMVQSEAGGFSRKEDQITFAGRVRFSGLDKIFERSVKSRLALGMLDKCEADKLLSGDEKNEENEENRERGVA